MYLPLSILVSTLILSGTLFFVGADVSKSMTGFVTAVQDSGLAAGSGSGSGSGNNVPSGDAGNAAPQAQPTPTPSPTIDMKALADDDPVEGNANAPVTIIEFSDFQCPFCERFYTGTLSQIRKDYIDTGKVKLIYRDFPLNFHPEAQKAAEAAGCAEEQGKFWEYHDKIFQNQAALGVASEKQWAKDLGLDTAKFNQCLDSGSRNSEISKDLSDGQNAGISGTPTFFINGQKVVGAQPYSVFQQIIDAELAG